MKRVLLRAPLLSLSGYGIHSRQIFEWLETLPGIDLSVEVLSWGQTAWLVNPEYENGIVGRIMKRASDIKPPYDYSFQVQLPDEWDTKLGKKNIGISAYVETNRCSDKWVEKTNQMDAVIVPSSFTRNVVNRSGVVTSPITVIPEWYNQEIDTVKDHLDFEIKSAFNFLMIGTITAPNANDDRKNIFNGLKWFCERFRDNKKVGLVLKANFGKCTTIDRQLTLNAVNKALKEVRSGQYPRVTLIHGSLTQKEMASLYKHPKIKCLIAPTKGEGYGLPIIEAAASGIPIIATGWSGHTDFLEKGKYLDIDYKLANISDSKIDNRVFVKDAMWADVSEKSFKRKLKSLKDNYNFHCKNAKNMQKTIKSKFCKRYVLSEYNNFFSDLCKSN